MRNIAYVCRYGHQDFFRVTGRDPIRQPLSEFELQIFAACLVEHWNNENKTDKFGPSSED